MLDILNPVAVFGIVVGIFLVLYSTAKLVQLQYFSNFMRQLIDQYYNSENCWHINENNRLELLPFPYNIEASYHRLLTGCPVNFSQFDRYLVLAA